MTDLCLLGILHGCSHNLCSALLCCSLLKKGAAFLKSANSLKSPSPFFEKCCFKSAKHWIVRFIAPGFGADKLSLTITLTRLMFPYIFFIGLVGMLLDLALSAASGGLDVRLPAITPPRMTRLWAAGTPAIRDGPP